MVIIGGHAGGGRKIGDVDFGPRPRFDEDAVTLDWYDYLFKGVQNEFAGKPVKYFRHGRKRNGAMKTTGHWPERAAQNIFSIRQARRTLCVATVRFPPSATN